MKNKVNTHIKLTDTQYRALKYTAKILNIGVSDVIKIIVAMLIRVVDNSLKLKVKYNKYITLLDKVDYDKNRLRTPHITLSVNDHIFLRDIKARNFRSSMALLIRLGIEMFINEIIGSAKGKNRLNEKRDYKILVVISDEHCEMVGIESERLLL